MITDNELVKLSISEAVIPPNGNGLSSRAFQPPFNFLCIFNWINIESGVESIVFDGHPITKTELKGDLLRLIGRRRYYHRVLLKPSPLEVEREAISKDQLHVKMKTSIKYEVINPGYVCSVQSPLVELSEIVNQAMGDCISAFDSEYLISQNEQIRSFVYTRIQNSQIVKNNYRIIEVLQIVPTIDERFIEIKNEITEAEINAGLIDITGKNDVLANTYETTIKKENEKLNQEILDRDHERTVHMEIIKQNAETLRASFDALKGLAASGIDPTAITRDVISLMNQTNKYHSANPQIQSTDNSNLLLSIDGDTDYEAQQIEKEKTALNLIKQDIGLLTYNIIKNAQGFFALLEFEKFEIHFSCSTNYPIEPPIATIRYQDGTEKKPENYWIPNVNNLLAQSLIKIISEA